MSRRTKHLRGQQQRGLAERRDNRLGCYSFLGGSVKRLWYECIFLLSADLILALCGAKSKDVCMV